jgi:hypothetical protein
VLYKQPNNQATIILDFGKEFPNLKLAHQHLFFCFLLPPLTLSVDPSLSSAFPFSSSLLRCFLTFFPSCHQSQRAAALTHLLSEAGRHTHEVLLQLLCFFGKDVIGACSPFVSRNRVSCFFRVIVDADNLGILCFVSPP